MLTSLRLDRADSGCFEREFPFVRRLIVVYSPHPLPPSPSRGYLAWNLFGINRMAEACAAKVVIANDLLLNNLL
jgi:hypothetical protein